MREEERERERDPFLERVTGKSTFRSDRVSSLDRSKSHERNSFSRSVDRDVSREKGRMQAEAMILQVSSRETERSTSTVAVKNDKQGERERGREKKGNRDGKVSKEAENLCNNRETSDSPSRKKTGKGSKGRGERERAPVWYPNSNATSYYRRLAWRRDDNRGKK